MFRTPITTRGGASASLMPEHRPEDGHPRRWNFIFRKVEYNIDVDQQLHDALKRSSTSEEKQRLLDREAKRISNPEMPQLPYHGPEEGFPYRWYFPIQNRTEFIDVSQQRHDALQRSDNPQRIKMLLEEENNRRLNFEKQKGSLLVGSMNTPTRSEAGGATSTPAHGGTGTVDSNPLQRGVDGAHGGTGGRENIKPKQLYNSEDEDDAEITTIEERHKRLTATMNKGAVGQREGNQNENLLDEEAKQTRIDCANRHHEFELRTKKHLSAPAKRFTQAYRTCKYHFVTKADKKISEDLAQQAFQLLIQSYYEMDEARDYCLRVLSEEDIRNNPHYEEYMVKRLDQLNECSMLLDQYLERWYRQDTQHHHIPPTQGKEQLASNSVFVEGAGNTSEIPPPGMANVNQPEGESPQQPGQSDYCQPGFPSSMNAITPIPKGPGQAAFQVYQEPQQAIPIKHRDPFTYQGQNLVQNNQQQQTQTRFKLEEELNLVGNWDANNPRDYMAFKAQWKNFETKMRKTGRTSMDLYNALLKKVGSRAKALIKNNYITDTNADSVYKEAIDNLDKQFYQPSDLLRRLMTTLSKTNKMDDSYESLFDGYTKLQEVWRDLKHADLNEGQLKGLLFIATTEKSLSTGTWNHWLEVQNRALSSENPNECFNIHLYLEAISTAMKNAQKKQNACGNPSRSDDQRQKPKPKPRSTLFGAYNATAIPTSTAQNIHTPSNQKQARTKDGMCVFCKSNPHKYQLLCPKLKKMTPKDIWEIIIEEKIKCRMCLCTDHDTKNCEVTKKGLVLKCNIKKGNGEPCGGLHCRYLHRDFKKESTQDKRAKQ